MIKAIIKLSPIVLGLCFTACQSAAEKSAAADAKVQDAKKDLSDAKQDATIAAQQAATAEEWEAFKKDTELMIKSNETEISRLKEKIKSSGKKADAAFVESINKLEQKNKDMNMRLDAYGKNAQSDWASFKQEFNRDMQELGTALKNLTVSNK